MKKQKIITILTLLVFNFSAFAAQNATTTKYTQESKKILEMLQRDIEAATLAISVNETNAGHNMADFDYSLTLPEKQHVNLGILLDLTPNNIGYKVLSVTPNSEADKLGIKVKDIIQKINNTHIQNLPNTAVIELLYNLTPNQQLNLGIISEGTYKELSTIVEGINVPAVTFNIRTKNSSVAIEQNKDKSCGRVSVFFTTVQTREHGLFPVKFKKINGLRRDPDIWSFKLPIGKNRLYLYRGLVVNSSAIPDGEAMPIEIDVKANTTYYLASLSNTREENSIRTRIKRKAVEWKPIVWRTESEECEL